MVNIQLFPRRQLTLRNWRDAGVLALAALLLRLTIIFLVPEPDRQIDVAIYMEAGRLVNLGVNPYDFEDEPSIREAARSDVWAFRPFTNETQSRWNYYISSNLPLSTLIWSLIDKIGSSQRGFQIAFAIFDTVVCLTAALWLLSVWNGPPNAGLRYAILAGLVIVNPMPLIWGTLVTEDKSLTVFWIISGLLLVLSKSRALRFLGAFVLGCSVAYKLVGVFYVIPGLLAAGINVENRDRWRELALLLFVSAAGACIWFIPFGFDAVSKAIERLLITESLTTPAHSSPWRVFAIWWPNSWNLWRILACLGITVGGMLIAIKRHTPLVIWLSHVSVIYVGLWLFSGSPDRFAMVVLPMILVVGGYNYRAASRLAVAYFLCGLVALIALFLHRISFSSVEPEVAAALSIGIYTIVVTGEMFFIRPLPRDSKAISL